jgi:DNA-binding NtrC family response regulator
MKEPDLRQDNHLVQLADDQISLFLYDEQHPVNLRQARSVFEARLVERVLRACHGNVTRAAQALCLSRRTLQDKIQHLHIDIRRIRTEESVESHSSK